MIADDDLPRRRIVAALALCEQLEAILDRVPFTPSMSPRHVISNHVAAIVHNLRYGLQDIEEGLR